MCGIAGMIDPGRDANDMRAWARRMTDTIVHRGPDDKGCYAEDGMAIAMRRLSIIDLAGGHQPIANEAGTIQVVCNGEIYNFAELRAQLIQAGHRFSTHSDTEVIVHLYEQHGMDCLAHLRGMFAIAIWDAERRRLILARDRLGKKPLYYARLGDRLFFGSEIKSLLAAEPRLQAADYTALPEFLQFGYLREPRTFFRHIFKLPAAHYAVYEQGRFQMAPYWTFAFQADTTCSESQWLEQLDALLAECVRIRLRSDVPLGVFLSGGLDSSAVVAYANRAGLRPLQTFTIGFDRDAWDESADALRIARHFGTEHHRLQLSSSELMGKLAETLLAIVHHCDEPFGDASALPTYHVSKLAREHVTVILSGDGGDELFAGYTTYRGALFAQRYRAALPNWLGRGLLPALVQAGAGLLPGRHRYAAQRVAKVLRDSALPWAAGLRDKISIWTSSDVRQLLTHELLKHSPFVDEQYLPDPLWQILHAPRDIVSRLSEIDIRSYLLDDILVKVDRMSMAHSLEVRSPLLDHHMLEFVARLPTHYKIQQGQGKALLRKVLRRYLPPSALTKPKQGFSVPLRDWFRRGFAEMLGDYLLGGSSRLPAELFVRSKVEAILDEHRRGVADHGRKIWLLLVFAAWQDQYQQGETPQCAASLES